jgi:hypothetical protein
MIYLPSSNLFSYLCLPIYETYFLQNLFTKVKPNINSGSSNGHPMDGALVGCWFTVLWPKSPTMRQREQRTRDPLPLLPRTHQVLIALLVLRRRMWTIHLTWLNSTIGLWNGPLWGRGGNGNEAGRGERKRVFSRKNKAAAFNTRAISSCRLKGHPSVRSQLETGIHKDWQAEVPSVWFGVKIWLKLRKL